MTFKVKPKNLLIKEIKILNVVSSLKTEVTKNFIPTL